MSLAKYWCEKHWNPAKIEWGFKSFVQSIDGDLNDDEMTIQVRSLVDSGVTKKSSTSQFPWKAFWADSTLQGPSTHLFWSFRNSREKRHYQVCCASHGSSRTLVKNNWHKPWLKENALLFIVLKIAASLASLCGFTYYLVTWLTPDGLRFFGCREQGPI